MKHNPIATMLAALSGMAGNITANAESLYKRFVRTSQSRKSAPGAKRKGIKYMKPITVKDRMTFKPFFSMGFRGAARMRRSMGLVPAPTLDQVRALERSHKLRLDVIAGKMYLKGTLVPFNP